MRYVITVVSAALVCSAMAQVAVAQPQDPFPPWWHGHWSQTFQWWLFDTEETGQGVPGGLPPDGPGPLDEGPPYVPGYLPSTNVVVNPFPDVWYPVDPLHGSNRTGIWPLSGSIDVIVDNHNPPNEFKWMWVQVTWAQEVPGGTDFPAFTNLVPAADPAWPVTVTNEMDWGDGWFTTLFEWRIYPNPVDEQFTIGFEGMDGILVDELVIDTWCIPEPATLSLLAFGGLLLARRRR